MIDGNLSQTPQRSFDLKARITMKSMVWEISMWVKMFWNFPNIIRAYFRCSLKWRGGEWSFQKIWVSQNFNWISRVSQSCFLSGSALVFWVVLRVSQSQFFWKAVLESQSHNLKSLGLAEKNACLAKSRIYHSPPLNEWTIIIAPDTTIYKTIYQ